MEGALRAGGEEEVSHRRDGAPEQRHVDNGAPPLQASAAVVSCTEESVGAAGDEDDDSSVEEWKYGNPGHAGNGDELYGEHMDEEDEAWVYKHLRGGVEETVSIRQTSTKSSSSASNRNHANNNDNESNLQQAKLLKPRNSDAVLSCPCCFNIVCMDCQRHERYENQFRAMFVMNIGVDWDKQLVYSNQQKGLVVKKTTSTTTTNNNRGSENSTLLLHEEQQPEQEKEAIYYSVHCINCQTEVAALNMDDEVYHFFGCLASA